MGGHGFVLADTVTFAEGQVIFEAGSTWGRESSTSYLRRAAALRGVAFVTADLFAEGVDAVDFITHRWPGGRIGFAYLDSWDWPYWNMDQSQLAQHRAQYEAAGRELTEDASALHHLQLAEQVHARAADGCVVAIDDTWRTDQSWDGKGRDAVPWLLDHGWDVHAEHVDVWEGEGASGGNAFYVAVVKTAARKPSTKRGAGR